MVNATVPTREFVYHYPVPRELSIKDGQIKKWIDISKMCRYNCSKNDDMSIFIIYTTSRHGYIKVNPKHSKMKNLTLIKYSLIIGITLAHDLNYAMYLILEIKRRYF